MLDFYRELRWRMVKMVRNAYEMAIPEKNCRFFSEEIDEKMKNGLKWVVRRAFRALTIAFFSNFLRQIDW